MKVNQLAMQEAIELFKEDLKDGKCNDTCPECKARELAIFALEKQIPKKPIIHGFREGREINTISYTCPICNKHTSRENYCKYCGQALDWGA